MNNSLEQKLVNGIGKKILVMLESFPFFVVGTLEFVSNGQIGVNVTFGVPLPLKNRIFEIGLTKISAFYVEECPGDIPNVW